MTSIAAGRGGERRAAGFPACGPFLPLPASCFTFSFVRALVPCLSADFPPAPPEPRPCASLCALFFFHPRRAVPPASRALAASRLAPFPFPSPEPYRLPGFLLSLPSSFFFPVGAAAPHPVFPFSAWGGCLAFSRALRYPPQASSLPDCPYCGVSFCDRRCRSRTLPAPRPFFSARPAAPPLPRADVVIFMSEQRLF